MHFVLLHIRRLLGEIKISEVYRQFPLSHQVFAVNFNRLL